MWSPARPTLSRDVADVVLLLASRGELVPTRQRGQHLGARPVGWVLEYVGRISHGAWG